MAIVSSTFVFVIPPVVRQPRPPQLPFSLSKVPNFVSKLPSDDFRCQTVNTSDVQPHGDDDGDDVDEQEDADGYSQ